MSNVVRNRLPASWRSEPRRALRQPHLGVARPQGIVPVPVPAPTSRRPIRVAAVLDGFSMQALGFEVDLIALTPTNWRQVLDTRPDLLLVESAWQGPEDQWRLLVRRDQPGHQVLSEMVTAFQARGVPTVFWNKEDPLHFDDFSDAASLFDRVYTTDADMLEEYGRLVGADRCGLWPFAAQPLLHNPVAVAAGRDHNVAFAGSWYADRYPQRRVQMFQVVDPARHHGLHIYSRFDNNPVHQFPAPLDTHVVGSLTYLETLHVYKRYRVHLNVNSVPRSTSMCSRRLFELTASGTPVVSGPSPAIAATLGDGVVMESDDPLYTDAVLTSLLADGDARARLGVAGVRTTLANHTYAHRIDAVLADVGLGARQVEASPSSEGVVVAVEATSVDGTRRTVGDLSPSVPPNSTLVVVPADVGVGGLSDGLEVFASDTGFAEARVLSSPAAGQLVTRNDARPVVMVADRHRYGPDFVGDLVLAQLYRPGVTVGKAACHQWSGGSHRAVAHTLEYTDTSDLQPSSLLVPAAVLRQVIAAVPDVTLLAADHHHFCNGGFATDRFNFLVDGGGVDGMRAPSRQDSPGNGLGAWMA